MKKMEPKYFPEINYLRGFAILAVISIHISAYFTKMESINLLTVFYMAIDAFSHFAVPAFIFISGFLLYNKYYKNVGKQKFYLKRLESVIPQYLSFSTFYIIALYYGSNLIGRTIDWRFSSIVYRYLTGGAFYHLWFFVLIIQMYILYPYILKIYDYFQYKNKLQLLVIITFLLAITYDSFIDRTSLLGEVLLFSGYGIYFIFGMFARDHYDTLKSILFKRNCAFLSSIIFFVGTFLLIMNYANLYYSYDLFGSSSIVKLSLNAISILYYTVNIIIFLYVSTILSNSSKLKSIDKIGSYSFGIYLVHAIILYTIVLLFSKVHFDWNNLLFYPTMLFLTLNLSLFSVKIISLFPNSEYIVGKL